VTFRKNSAVHGFVEGSNAACKEHSDQRSGGKRGRESAIENADIGITSVLQICVLLIMGSMNEGWREILRGWLPSPLS
jgi:hypothetical protein